MDTAREVLQNLLATKRLLNYEESYGDIVLRELARVFDEPISEISEIDFREFTLTTFGYVIKQNDKILKMLLLMACYLAGQGTSSIPKSPFEEET